MAQLLDKLILGAIFCFLALSQEAAAGDEINKGREIAKKHCTRCHVVGDINPHGGISSTPSFQIMVTALKDWEERFETFHVRRPHPAIIRFKGFEYPDDLPSTVPILLEVEDIEALLAFAHHLHKIHKN